MGRLKTVKKTTINIVWVGRALFAFNAAVERTMTTTITILVLCLMPILLCCAIGAILQLNVIK